ncbi:MAG TPA: MotA/TolQ/ExbB proton channel family protein [Candidatus Krumholzibacteria bacterium]|nr:MotA/TolQ/ExbB proton channel family protein [Candidatus Krumholzibacteria bacterium]HPD71684.1 MotA/TolQ/ExbB proton channel family protein [Candidatus Krumholzibacteria bacterium]HRY41383.1 MotA/TolQ/ExbB proton channel family protein [Candidatus Krumholzibacteria bacterium]
MPVACLPLTFGSADLIGLTLEMTFMGKAILLILLILSVVSWAVMVEKARVLVRIRGGHRQFWQRLDDWADGRGGDLRAWCEARPDLPLANQFVETLGLEDAPSVRRASERVAYLEIERLERYLMILSTTVTIAPFLGLLGTVWGIMTAFWDMSSLQSAGLTVVAPGIAEALVTTIAGLAAAIPAVVFYNSLVRKIDLLANEMERLRTVLEERAGGGRGEVYPGARDVANRPDWHEKERI